MSMNFLLLYSFRTLTLICIPENVKKDTGIKVTKFLLKLQHAFGCVRVKLKI